jgi:signal peptidase
VTVGRAKGYPPEVVRSMRVLLALWDELRDKPGPFHFELRGASMWPAAPEGSILAVAPCPASALREGDLVTFRRDRALITHRVVGLDPRGRVLAWGDSLLHPDPPIAPADVLGRATVVRRGPTLARWWIGWIAARRAGAAALRLVRRAEGARRDRRAGHAA